ncbi:MAG: hypothetical protein AB7F50_00140 [Fimbriimonadaceae bacterium]
MSAPMQEAKEIDAAVLGIYSAISGPAGKERDWKAFKEMFQPEARMTVVAGKDGKDTVVRDVDGYIELAGPFLLTNGFFEKEVARRTERYGNMAHVWSTYESRMKEDEEPFDRGINSILLVLTEKGWKVANICWTSERSAGPIPEKYLKSG